MLEMKEADEDGAFQAGRERRGEGCRELLRVAETASVLTEVVSSSQARNKGDGKSRKSTRRKGVDDAHAVEAAERRHSSAYSTLVEQAGRWKKARLSVFSRSAGGRVGERAILVLLYSQAVWLPFLLIHIDVPATPGPPPRRPPPSARTLPSSS